MPLGSFARIDNWQFSSSKRGIRKRVACDLQTALWSMETLSLFTLVLIASCLAPSLQAKDVIMDKSPDGNFALRIQLPKEAGDQPKVGMINLLTQEAVLQLDCHHCYERNAKPKLLWFSDSQRVAYRAR